MNNKCVKICIMMLFVTFVFSQEAQLQTNNNPNQISSNIKQTPPETALPEVTKSDFSSENMQPLRGSEPNNDETIGDEDINEATLFNKYQDFMHKYRKTYSDLQELN